MSGKICAATGSGVFKVEISNLDVRKVRMTTSSSRNESVDLIFAFAAISSVESMAKSGETPKFKNLPPPPFRRAMTDFFQARIRDANFLLCFLPSCSLYIEKFYSKFQNIRVFLMSFLLSYLFYAV